MFKGQGSCVRAIKTRGHDPPDPSTPEGRPPSSALRHGSFWAVQPERCGRQVLVLQPPRGRAQWGLRTRGMELGRRTGGDADTDTDSMCSSEASLWRLSLCPPWVQGSLTPHTCRDDGAAGLARPWLWDSPWTSASEGRARSTPQCSSLRLPMPSVEPGTRSTASGLAPPGISGKACLSSASSHRDSWLPW